MGSNSKFTLFLIFMVVTTLYGVAGLIMISINAWRHTLGMHLTSEWLFWVFIACFVPLLVFAYMFVLDSIKERNN